MNIKLISHTENPEKVVAAAAKLCYSKSEIGTLMDNLTDEKVCEFLDRLSNLGHASPTEHASFTFGIEGVSRSFLAQISRHRLASLSVQSQRYVDMTNAGFVMPEEFADDEPASKTFEDAVGYALESYEGLRKYLTVRYIRSGMDTKSAEKKAQEDARYVLPEACCTKMIVTMNARELNHFFNLRCCCYDDKTEVLTQNGWKLFKDLKEDDIFYSLNKDTQECEFVKAKGFISYNYEGEMYSVKSQSIDLLITPNHSVLYSPSYDNKKWYLDEVQNITDKKCILMKKNCNPIQGQKEEYFVIDDIKVKDRNQFTEWERAIPGYKVKLNDFMRILGFYLSDGYTTNCNHHYNVGFSKGNLNLLNEYKALLDKFVSHKTRIFTDRGSYKLEVDDRVLYEFFKPLGNCHTKRIPDFVWKYDSSNLEYLYKGFLDGDFSNNGTVMATVSPKMADDIQRLMLHIGYSSSIAVVDRRGNVSEGLDSAGNPYRIISKSIVYTVSVNKSKNEPIIKSSNRTPFSIEQYSGMVYCVDLEKNHTLYVRRNGKTVWSGNCRAQWEIRECAEKMLALVYPIAPHLFKNAGPSCVCGACPEGSMSCGKAKEMREKYSKIKV